MLGRRQWKSFAPRNWTRLGMAVPLCVVVVLAGGLGLWSITAPRAETKATPAFTGSESCSACHAEQAAAWRDSHHGWALREPHRENILGDFDNATFEFGGVRFRFFRRNGKAFVETDGPDGASTAYEIKYTVGVEPLQQYLVELDGGQLQALDVAWDTGAKRWFHLLVDGPAKVGEGLHWTGPYTNWQARCAVCHQTNFEKGYDPQSKTYQSRWSELTVGCEACHGPGGAHIAWARTRSGGETDEATAGLGLTVALNDGKIDVATEFEVCAGCHSRRSPLGGDSVPPGAPFADHYSLSLLRDGLYYADGQIDDEVYVLASFLQSKMYASGVSCTNCHDPHATKLLADGDAVCTQCHNPKGRADFPTLAKAAYDRPEHHKHPPGSTGARCISCHMPVKTYMIVDPRSDHSFRVPRPDLSVKIGTPNVCTGCHNDRSAGWAAKTVKAWYPQGRWREPHYGEVLHAGRTRGDTEATKALIELIGNRKQPAIVRASAIQLLGARFDENIGRTLVRLLEDSEPLVRRAAVTALGAAPRSLRARLVVSKMADPIRFVRAAAARVTIDIPTTGLTAEERLIVEHARADLWATIRALADYPEMQMRIGGFALLLRNLRAADTAFREAARMDPQLTEAWMSRALIALAERRIEYAAAILHQGLEENSDSALLRQSHGNVLVQLGALEPALQELNDAARLAPNEPSILIDIATIHTLRGENQKALAVLSKARGMGANGPDLLESLAVTNKRLGRIADARALAVELVNRFPQYQLRPELEELLEGSE